MNQGKQPDILCVGRAGTEVLVFTEDAELACAADRERYEMCFDYAAKIPARDVYEIDGTGAGANAAIAFSRQGFRAALYAAAGSDINGLQLRKILKKEKVLLIEDAESADTYSGAVIAAAGGKLRMGTDGAVSGKAALPPAKWVYAAFGPTETAIAETFRRHADECGSRSILRPKGIAGKAEGEMMLKLARKADLLIVNLKDAEVMAGKKADAAAAASALAKKGVIQAVVSDGKKGAASASVAGVLTIAAFPDGKRRVFGAYAGDAFAAGYAAAFMRGSTAAACLSEAMASAWSVVGAPDPKIGLPDTDGIGNIVRRFFRVVARRA